MSWPTPQDYNEAMQHPEYSFRDEELRQGTTELNALGLPRGATGTFASVYRLYCPRADYAVRCFLFDTPDQQNRYAEISKYILADQRQYELPLGDSLLQYPINQTRGSKFESSTEICTEVTA